MLKKVNAKFNHRTWSLRQHFLGTHRPSGSPGPPEIVQTADDDEIHETKSASPSSQDKISPTVYQPSHGRVETPVGASKQPGAMLSSGATVSALGREDRIFAWTGLKMLQGALNESVALFGPLKSVIDGIAECIGTFEEDSRAQEDYRTLKADLDTMFEEMRKLLIAAKTKATRKAIAEATSDVSNELELIARKREQSDISRLVDATDYVDDIGNFYRKTQQIFNLLIIRVNTSMIEEANNLITDQRLKNLPNSLAARYRSAQAAALRRGPCIPNTRVEALSGLHHWAEDPASHRVYWLNGMAGTGKTTIAYSLCQELQSAGKLAASFFCSRQLPECRDANRILPTIACQLASRWPAFREALSNVLEKEPDAYDSPLDDQFEQLIAAPLEAARNEYPAGQIVVIDALDECDDKDIVDQLLAVIFAGGLAFPVRFFVTSRPDAKIRDRIENEQKDGQRRIMHLHELASVEVQKDIRTYLRVKLERADVSSAQMDMLVERSGALFIYAATVVRYVGYDNFSRSTSRLIQVLGIAKVAGYAPERDMDMLYANILGAAMEDPGTEVAERRLMMDVLCTVICARESLSLDCIGNLLGVVGADSIASALRPLYSVVNIAQPTGTVVTLHESFPNYILDPARSNGFYCDPRARHASMTHQCLDMIAAVSPPFNVCQLESSCMLDEEVGDLQEKIGRYISNALSYACRYWTEHLILAAQSVDLADRVEKLMRERLLLWLEVMSLKRYHSDVGTVLSKLLKWSRSAGYTLDTDDLIQDALQFATAFSMGAARWSTPHIYVSGLTCWPNHRSLSRHYKPRISSCIALTGSGVDGQLWATLGEVRAKKGGLCMALSPDGRHVVCGYDDCTLLIWDVHTGYQVGEPLEGHTSAVYSVAYSPDGTHILSGSSDSTLHIWNAGTGRQAGPALQGHTNAVLSVGYSPDGPHIAAGASDGTLRIWDANTGQQVGKPLQGHTGIVCSVTYSPDGARIISGSDDRTIRIWDAYSRQQVGQPLEGHTNTVGSVACSPDGSRIVSGSDDHTLRIWDSDTGLQVGQPLEGHSGAVVSVAYSPNGVHIASGSDDHTLRIWDACNGKQTGQSLQGHNAPIYSVTYSPDGAHIVSGSDDCTLHVWDARILQQKQQPLCGHTNTVRSVAYSSDGANLVSGSYDCTLCIWDARTGRRVGLPLEGHIGAVRSVAYSPDGTRVVSGSSDGTLRIWDAHTGQQVGHPLKGHTCAVQSVTYSPNGIHVASGSDDHTLCIWDVHAGRQLGQQLVGHTDAVRSAAYSPNGAYIVSGSSDRTLLVWDAHTGKLVGQPLHGHTGAVYSVAYLPDGARIVSGSDDRTLRIWDIHSHHQVGKSLEGHTSAVYSVACSPNGVNVVSGSDDCTIRIWNVCTGQQVQTLAGSTGYVLSVAFSPDGEYIVSGSYDHTIRIWQPNHHLVPSRLAQSTTSSRLFHTGTAKQLHQPFSQWTCNSDGWVAASTGERILWIPSDLHRLLLPPWNILLISTDPSLHLDFSDAYLGKGWVDCYNPAD